MSRQHLAHINHLSILYVHRYPCTFASWWCGGEFSENDCAMPITLHSDPPSSAENMSLLTRVLNMIDVDDLKCGIVRQELKVK